MHSPAPKLAAVLLITTYCLLSTAKLAYGQVAMVVSPPSYNLEVKPGEVIQKTVKVTNPSDVEPLRLKVKISDFIVQDDQGTPTQVTSEASGRFLASPWLSLDQTEFTLDPRGQALVNVVITVPQDALPGGHYAGVFFEPVVKLDKSGSAAYTSAEVGSLFGLTVAGNLHYDALIKDFGVGQNLYEFGPVQFTGTVENQSDTHITPRSSIVVHDMLGRTVSTLKLDEPNIFPFAARSLSGTWDTVWGLGRYSATLLVSYGPGLEASRTLYFWIAPYRLLAGILVIALSLLGLFVALRRHLAHRADSRDVEIDELKRRIVELENKR